VMQALRFGALVFAFALAGCVATPTPEDPARCAVGVSGSHSHGTSFGYHSEEWSETVWAECSM
jgi:hypothetical protein